MGSRRGTVLDGCVVVDDDDDDGGGMVDEFEAAMVEE
jgi:hypothetical protein